MKKDIDTIPNLYSITGNVLDINTVLINREELRKLIEGKEELVYSCRELLGHLGVVLPDEAYDIVDVQKWNAVSACIGKYKD